MRPCVGWARPRRGARFHKCVRQPRRGSNSERSCSSFTLVTPVLGRYLAAVYGAAVRLPGAAGADVEAGILYRLCRIDPAREMSWTAYLTAVVIFTAISMAALFVLLCTQQWLPFNPQHWANLPPLLALNVAASFATTTNWQWPYSGREYARLPGTDGRAGATLARTSWRQASAWPSRSLRFAASRARR